jgi:hypothetical protein
MPACPSGKGRLGESKATGSGEGKMADGARREVLLGLTVCSRMKEDHGSSSKQQLRIQSVPQRKQLIFITMINWLTLVKEIIAVLL